MNPIPFDNSYIRLPQSCYSRLEPTPVAKPALIRANDALARQLGIKPDWLASDEGVAVIAGNAVPEGAQPLAAVYSGHQFGSYNPQLGDGRAILLGEVVDTDGARFDIQLKGSGPTPYSRGGDGRSPLGPVLREYLVSEAMHALGVPTTRALAAVTTGERVARDRFLPGAVLARVAASHIRIGTLQYFAAERDNETLTELVQHTLARHYPDTDSGESPALALLQQVVAAQAELVARWQLLGFIHGVMNTDNMLLSGQTIDYGPCAFMDGFDPATVFSSIDRGGRYAYRNQPGIAHWNLAVLAQALLPLLDDDQERAVALAQEAIDRFPPQFSAAHREGLYHKLGLTPPSDATADAEFIEALFSGMAQAGADFTLTFHHLSERAGAADTATDAIYRPDPALEPWLAQWQRRFDDDPGDQQQRRERMLHANPLYIPRNHLVEQAINAAQDNGDLAPFQALVDWLSVPPQTPRPLREEYARPPAPGEEIEATFCGT